MTGIKTHPITTQFHLSKCTGKSCPPTSFVVRSGFDNRLSEAEHSLLIRKAFEHAVTVYCEQYFDQYFEAQLDPDTLQPEQNDETKLWEKWKDLISAGLRNAVKSMNKSTGVRTEQSIRWIAGEPDCIDGFDRSRTEVYKTVVHIYRDDEGSIERMEVGAEDCDDTTEVASCDGDTEPAKGTVHRPEEEAENRESIQPNHSESPPEKPEEGD